MFGMARRPVFSISQGSKLTLPRLPEASRNRRGRVIFWHNLSDGQANKKQQIKQHQKII